ncbi:hypothetical protein DMH04_44460 [Kibdelosporangium aridum]|uniref:Uncharacterized protein n=1 Tax=Kibdelosporangium aridum TaxID=2030 RepID=A0A428YQ64_KIBAR|nr:hypothetical protein [Kibdelosporangium aridum]RSM70667.1 hypothetical protein DMH04_44460 [Kibdelosporangium aridum]
MRTDERVTLAMLVVAGVLATALSFAEPSVQVVLTATVLVPPAMALSRLNRTGGAMSSGLVSGGAGILAGHPAAGASPHWDPARADPSTDGGSFSLAAGASPHPPR